MPHKDPGKARAYERERHRKRAAERRAQGLCPRCGKRRPAAGRKVCESCGDKRRATESARYARGKAEGKPYGGRKPESRRRCARERSKRRRHGRREAGLCTSCGDTPPAGGGAVCEPCREVRRADERELYAARRAAGLCGRCGGPVFAGASLCGSCAALGNGRDRKRRNAARRGVTPKGELDAFAPTAESPHRGPRGASPARAVPTTPRASTAACRSTRRATPCSNSPPARTTGHGTVGRRSPCASPSRSSRVRKSRW